MTDIIQKIYNVWDLRPHGDDVLIESFSSRKAAEECVKFKEAENDLYNDSYIRSVHHYKILECVPSDTFIISKNEALPELVPVISYYDEDLQKWRGYVLGDYKRFREPRDLIEFRIKEEFDRDANFPHWSNPRAKVSPKWNHDYSFIIFIPYQRELRYEEYGNLAIPEAMKYLNRYEKLILEASQVSPIALIRNYKFIPQQEQIEKAYEQVLHMIDCSIPGYDSHYRTITCEQLQDQFKLWRQEIIDQRFEFRIPKE